MDKQHPIDTDPGTKQLIVADPSAVEIAHQQSSGQIEHPDVLHEGTDISFRAFGLSALVIGITLAAVVGAIRLFVQERKASDPDQAHRSAESSLRIPLPAAPRLEAIESPTPAFNSFAGAEQERHVRLHSSGPADGSGFVHIPIEKAMEKVAKDLQSQTPPAPQTSKSRGLASGGEANSGRVFREDPR